MPDSFRAKIAKKNECKQRKMEIIILTYRDSSGVYTICKMTIKLLILKGSSDYPSFLIACSPRLQVRKYCQGILPVMSPAELPCHQKRRVCNRNSI